MQAWNFSAGGNLPTVSQRYVLGRARRTFRELVRRLPCWDLLARAGVDTVLEVCPRHVQGVKWWKDLRCVWRGHVPDIEWGVILRAVPSWVICKHFWVFNLRPVFGGIVSSRVRGDCVHGVPQRV